MSEILEHVKIIPAEENHISFVFSSWLKSYKESDFAKIVSNHIFYKEHHALIDSLLKKGQCFVAVNKTDEDQIYGWICANIVNKPHLLHYVYVKHPYRGLGLSKIMLAILEKPYVYTHQGKIKHRAENTYSPYEFFREALNK